MKQIESKEQQRQDIQCALDSKKTQEERNIMGQFSTPIALSKGILEHAEKLLPKKELVSFLDPAIGTGSFYSALNQVFDANRVLKSVGYEIDEHYGLPSKEIWEGFPLEYLLGDFTKTDAPENEDDKFNLVICNPPYVRHHHLGSDKQRLKKETFRLSNMSLSGYSGLYCYFMGLAHPWMKKDGIAGWLIPSEFMDVNYGQGVKNYLLNEVTLLQIHRFDPKDIQFNDALVSSAVVWFKNKKPSKSHKVSFTFGGTIDNPQIEKKVSLDSLAKETKWTRFPSMQERTKGTHPVLSDFFTIKRGIATGDNNFFIMSRDKLEERQLPIEHFRPILPSPRFINETVIESDENGYPIIDNQLFVLDCKLSIDEIEHQYPELYNYLMLGIDEGVSSRYLCSKRKIWYSQENRESSSFYCTYIGRTDSNGRNPFRFLLNHSNAIVNNSYLILYPKPILMKDLESHPNHKELIIEALSRITGDAMVQEGRVYGGGMHKLEPKELAKVNAMEIANLITE